MEPYNAHPSELGPDSARRFLARPGFVGSYVGTNGGTAASFAPARCGLDQELISNAKEEIAMHSYAVSNVGQQKPSGSGAEACFRFHGFELLPASRRLMHEGMPIDLTEKRLDLLMELVGRSGDLVTSHELLTRLWPDVSPGSPPDECLLWQEMAAVRQALGPAQHLIRTVPGQGYIFDVAAILPVADGGWPSPAHVGQTVRGARPRVTIIDDDEGSCLALRSLLRSAGLSVECYGSVSAFSASKQLTLPGCLILDVRLPGQSGLEFQEELARAEISVPVIIMTGYADVPMSIRAMKAGAIEFLMKPVLPQRLLAAIQFAIESGPSRPPVLRWFDSADTQTRHERGGLAPWQERRAKEAVANGLSAELSIAQVATECGMSRGHFARAFKQSTGATPHQWLTRQRIEKAKGLMLDGVALAEVALLCGFADQSHFSRVFARSEGRPPGAWQRRERHWTIATPK